MAPRALSWLTLALAPLLFTAVPACGSSGSQSDGGTDGAEPDVLSPDTGLDTGVDTGFGDTGVDTGLDTGADTGLGGDTGSDTGPPDAGSDASGDATVPDSSLDGAFDAGPPADVIVLPDGVVPPSDVTTVCSVPLGFGFVGPGSCGTGEEYMCGPHDYQIECDCPSGTCTCMKDAVPIGPSIAYKGGCPSCSSSPPWAALAAACGIPY